MRQTKKMDGIDSGIWESNAVQNVSILPITNFPFLLLKVLGFFDILESSK